jgi:prepilin-type N-terminal cleavage/methylation domain-containing protein
MSLSAFGAVGAIQNAPARRRGFSLIEVIAALGIFGFGMLVIVGLFAPVTRSVTTVSESEAAARVADSVRARLQTLRFESALTLIQEGADVRKNDANGAYNVNSGTNPAVLFGKLTGDVGIYDQATNRKRWYDSSVPTPQVVADGDKFFEVDLIRNDTLSPKSADATAAMVAYTMRVRWPAFQASSSGAAIQTGAGVGGAVPFDNGKKQVLFFSGAITR